MLGKYRRGIMALIVTLMVLLTVTGASAASPTEPKLEVPEYHAYGDKLTPWVYGSSDPDGDSFNYLCQFYNTNDLALIKDFSTDCTLEPTAADEGDVIRVTVVASDGTSHSREVKADVLIVEYIRETPTYEETLDCPEDTWLYTASNTPYCPGEATTAPPESEPEGFDKYKSQALLVGGVIWPSSPVGGLAVLGFGVVLLINFILDQREKRKIRSRVDELSKKEDDDDWF